ncbi:MAG: hypothetical protein E6Q66_10520 [Pedobacter sp.]|nr:MAG: hypothetical protein E6Q66_10520 [Pedobacter sp.]
MTKKEIDAIIRSGSAKTRLLLLFEDISKFQFDQERILTPSDFQRLFDSIRKPRELKLYETFRLIDSTIIEAIVNLRVLMFEVKMHYSDLRGYLFLVDTLEKTEAMVNAVLGEIKDINKQKSIIRGLKGASILLSNIEENEDGLMDIQIDFDKSKYDSGIPFRLRQSTLLEAMENVKKLVIDRAVKFLSWEKAILDYMDETGFNIKTYKDHLQQLTADIKRPVIGWERKDTRDVTLNPKADKRIIKHNMFPNISELEINTEYYDWFKTKFLRKQ